MLFNPKSVKPMIRNTFACGALLLLAVACGKGTDDRIAGMDAVTYKASDEVIPNPERGFYTPQEIHNASAKPISKDNVAINRKQARTLYLLEFYLTDFVNSDISAEYLETIRKNFAAMRDGGAKCILRFCYSNGFAEKDKPWDATPTQALRHIAQVKPLLQEYGDILFVVQAGFIGSWGEWYYTENYGDSKDPNRKAIVDALLDAVPADRQIELRTPQFKMDLYGYSYSDTLTRATWAVTTTATWPAAMTREPTAERTTAPTGAPKAAIPSWAARPAVFRTTASACRRKATPTPPSSARWPTWPSTTSLT